MNAIEQLETFLESSSEKVRKNVNIITPEVSNIKSMLHISKDTNIKTFIPRIGTRQASSEDRTIPRITVAPTVFGCFIGYVAAKNDFLDLISNGDKDQLKYKGGWIIYDFEYEAALAPNNRLVYDFKQSDEHWLVSYSKETAEYKPTKAGKVFYRSITFVSKTESIPEEEGSLIVEVIKDTGIQFSKNIFLSKGYWVIDGPVVSSTSNWIKDKDFNVKEITADEYRAIKNESAALLSDTNRPEYLKW